MLIYQKLLLGNESYYSNMGTVVNFVIHRHPEIELSYCLRGPYSIVVDNKKYQLNDGDLAVIAPMVAHEVVDCKDEESKSLTIKLGPVFMGDYFNTFLNMKSSSILFELKGTPYKKYSELRALFEQIADMHSKRPDFHNLITKGNLYIITALLLELLNEKKMLHASPIQHHNILKIEKALDIIYTRYPEPLDIEGVSSECGYSKASFCKIFKEITGETFHSALNRHRIEIACLHLENSSTSIEEIAASIGFSDIKSFCRVFKKITGESAGSYRKHMPNPDKHNKS